MLFGKISSLALTCIFLFAASVHAFNGRATWYYDGIGACGGFNVNSDHVVALPPLEYARGTRCGKMIRIYYQGKSIDARAVDLCPSCGLTGIDLSVSTFQALAPLDVGLIYVDWYYL